MMLRLLHPQGITGLAAAFCLAALLLLQNGKTRHWRKQSGQYELLYRSEQAAFAGTVANYRAAADAARAADKAAAEQLKAAQAAINQRSKYAFETRVADARARAASLAFGGLRLETPVSATDRGAGRAEAMPRLPAASGGADQTAGEGRLPDADRLIATEQAIQLDELIKWVRRQAAVARD